LICIFLFVPVYLFIKNSAEVYKCNDYTVYDYAKNILRHLPHNSLIFSDRADEVEFAVTYLIRIENVRPDIDFIDCNAGISRSIYGDDYYTIWGKKRLAIRSKVEQEMVSKSQRPVFYATALPKQTTTFKRPYGLLHSTKKSPEKLKISDEIFVLRAPLKNDIRSQTLFSSHFSLLSEYFLSINNISVAKKHSYAVAKLTGNFDSLLTIPYYYFHKGDFKQALKEYLELLKLNSNWQVVLLNLGVIYERLNEITKAEECYNKAIELKPDDPQAYYNIAVLYWRKADWKNVVKYLNKVIELSPENVDAHRYLSIAKTKL
ncbi:MAG: tetratricopeptide repeat protein, partial [Elusimicrobiota bacterium]|nr:tetratricopeptide repeat protein [Elusimicrobiota bacterium]